MLAPADMHAPPTDRQLQRGTKLVVARRQCVAAAGRVADPNPACARHLRSAPGRSEQYADLRDGRVADAGPGVVVRENLLPAPAVARVPGCAPLAHADAVAPASPGDDELRLRGRRCRDE